MGWLMWYLRHVLLERIIPNILEINIDAITSIKEAFRTSYYGLPLFAA